MSDTRARPSRHITGELFLRGPIPLRWLAAASGLGGKALHVGVFVWHLVGLHDSMRVKLSTRKLSNMGVTRQAAYKALVALEQQQLLLVERRPGCCPVVTLILRSKPPPVLSTASDLSQSRTPVAISFLTKE
jgi:hypothetical protein